MQHDWDDLYLCRNCGLAAEEAAEHGEDECAAHPGVASFRYYERRAIMREINEAAKAAIMWASREESGQEAAEKNT